MSSKARFLSSAAAISSTNGAMLSASLRTGTTMETAGAVALAKISLMICPTWRCDGRRASCQGELLWGDQLAGNPFEARKRGTGPWSNGYIGAKHEGESPRCIPIAYQQRTNHANDGSNHDIAGKMRPEHDAAHRDENGIGPQDETRAWP